MKSANKQHSRCACAAARGFVLTGTERKYERARPFLIQHLALALDIDFEQKSLEGTASFQLRRVDPAAGRLSLDAVGFDIHGVELDAQPVPHEYDGDCLSVEVPEAIGDAQLNVHYKVKPQRGMYFLQPDAQVPDRPRQLWTQCQDEDARYWFPCHDKPHIKMTTEIDVTVPKGFVVLSNGEQISKETKPKDKRWRYHFKLDEPHPSYLITLVAGEFEIIEDRPASLGSRLVPVRYYVPKGRKADAQRAFSETPRMIELFSKLIGVEYPWSTYSQVVVSDFVFGGMENTTATTMYEHVLLDKKASLDISSHELVAHELAHQWFGDFVTCRDWSEGWLNEGFATYFEHLEKQDRLGDHEYEYGIAADLEAYLRETRSRYARPVVCRDYEAPIDLFDRHLYEKGGLVLHMLRQELGDPLFFAGLRVYLERHARGIVESRDLQRALEEVSGRSLDRFLDQWLYRAGHPELKIKVSYSDGLLNIHVQQKQSGAAYEFDLDVEIEQQNGNYLQASKRLSVKADALIVALDKRPKQVALDPHLKLMGTVRLEAPADMLRHALRNAHKPSVRWRAAEALAKRQDPPTVRSLSEALNDEQEVWMVRAEAASALGRILGDDAFQALSAALKAEHPKVRRAAVVALGQFRRTEALQALKPFIKSDKSYLVQASAARAAGRTRQPAALKAITAVLDTPSWADVVRAGALDGLASLGDPASIDAVMERTNYGFPSRARRAAITALTELGEGARVRKHLEQLLDDDDPHVRNTVAIALKQFGDRRARPAIRRRMARELDARVKRSLFEASRDLNSEEEQSRRQLSSEVEALKNELSELRVRLAKVEQVSKDGKPVDIADAAPPPTPDKHKEASTPDSASASESGKSKKKREKPGSSRKRKASTKPKK